MRLYKIKKKKKKKAQASMLYSPRAPSKKGYENMLSDPQREKEIKI